MREFKTIVSRLSTLFTTPLLIQHPTQDVRLQRRTKSFKYKNSTRQRAKRGPSKKQLLVEENHHLSQQLYDACEQISAVADGLLCTHNYPSTRLSEAFALKEVDKMVPWMSSFRSPFYWLTFIVACRGPHTHGMVHRGGMQSSIPHLAFLFCSNRSSQIQRFMEDVEYLGREVLDLCGELERTDYEWTWFYKTPR